MEPMLTSAQVRETCGNVSDMTIWRWLKADQFPKPIYQNRRRYWRAGDVRAWWESRATADA